MQASHTTTRVDLQALLAERPRLVRLCAQLTGDADAAEDLAQETLIEAWRHAHQIRNYAAYPAWLSGIARNVCRRWARRRSRDATRRAQIVQTGDIALLEETVADTFDLEVELERDELATLLDRALARLPGETRAVLIQKYVEESSHAEIAERLGLSENVVAVRLHRGRLALRRLLTNELREDALAYGLVDQGREEWQETRIWCPRCGQHRLVGRRTDAEFVLLCRACSPDPRAAFYQAAMPEADRALKGFKATLSRLMADANSYFREGLATQTVGCPKCGAPVPLRMGMPPYEPWSAPYAPGLHFSCPCGAGSVSISLRMLNQSLPEVRRFWRQHPRMRTLPMQEIELEGTPAIVTTFQSVTGPASISVVSARDTFALLRIDRKGEQ